MKKNNPIFFLTLILACLLLTPDTALSGVSVGNAKDPNGSAMPRSKNIRTLRSRQRQQSAPCKEPEDKTQKNQDPCIPSQDGFLEFVFGFENN